MQGDDQGTRPETNGVFFPPGAYVFIIFATRDGEVFFFRTVSASRKSSGEDYTPNETIASEGTLRPRASDARTRNGDDETHHQSMSPTMDDKNAEATTRPDSTRGVDTFFFVPLPPSSSKTKTFSF